VNWQIQANIAAISKPEMGRIAKLSSGMQARRTDTVVSHVAAPRTHGEKLTNAMVALSRDSRRTSGVYCVHQIYGIFGDGKPMNAMFQKSTSMWKHVAAGMNAHYHMWDANELESLVKQKYAQYWDLYQNVRYPVMRVDIGRFLILHAYGGLYADCDIFPNRSYYEQAQLAVQRVPEPKNNKKPRLSTKKADHYLDMEVVVATQGNPILLELVDFMVNEIASKPYKSPLSFWYSARMRYIWQTTGPRAMARFFKQPEIAPKLNGMRHLECNHFSSTEMSHSETRFFDVFSLQSNSYFTDVHEIRVPVGQGDAQMPLVYKTRRMFGKSVAYALRVSSSFAAPSQAAAVPIADVASSKDAALPIGDAASTHDDVAGADADADAIRCMAPSQARIIDGLKHDLDEAHGIIDSFRAERNEDRDRALEFKKHFRKTRHSVSEQVVLSSMPDKVRAWLIEGWEEEYARSSGSVPSTPHKKMSSPL